MDHHDHDMGQDEADLAERGRSYVAAAVDQTRAPLGLRERLEADRRRTAPARRRRRASLGAVLAGATALALVAVVLALPSGTPGAPTVVEAAALAAASPAGTPPAADPRSPALLRAGHEGVRFPAWDEKFGWEAVGDRRSELDGRPTRTVFYRNAKGAVAGYTIVGGAPLDAPEDAQSAVVEGTRLLSFQREGRWVVTWERGGHTCVFSAPDTVALAKVRELAGWRAKGQIAF